jgi:hypothetical protein
MIAMLIVTSGREGAGITLLCITFVCHTFERNALQRLHRNVNEPSIVHPTASGSRFPRRLFSVTFSGNSTQTENKQDKRSQSAAPSELR